MAMDNIKISWDCTYTINIENMDIDDVYELKTAVKEKAAKPEKETPIFFTQIIDICDTIIKIDEQD